MQPSLFLFMLKNIKNNRYQICKQRKKAISLQHQNKINNNNNLNVGGNTINSATRL